MHLSPAAVITGGSRIPARLITSTAIMHSHWTTCIPGSACDLPPDWLLPCSILPHLQASSLQQQLSSVEEKQAKVVAALKEGWAAELKRQREGWAAAEKASRDKWLEAKTQVGCAAREHMQGLVDMGNRWVLPWSSAGSAL